MYKNNFNINGGQIKDCEAFTKIISIGFEFESANCIFLIEHENTLYSLSNLNKLPKRRCIDKHLQNGFGDRFDSSLVYKYDYKNNIEFIITEDEFEKNADLIKFFNDKENIIDDILNEDLTKTNLKLNIVDKLVDDVNIPNLEFHITFSKLDDNISKDIIFEKFKEACTIFTNHFKDFKEENYYLINNKKSIFRGVLFKKLQNSNIYYLFFKDYNYKYPTKFNDEDLNFRPQCTITCKLYDVLDVLKCCFEDSPDRNDENLFNKILKYSLDNIIISNLKDENNMQKIKNWIFLRLYEFIIFKKLDKTAEYYKNYCPILLRHNLSDITKSLLIIEPDLLKNIDIISDFEYTGWKTILKREIIIYLKCNIELKFKLDEIKAYTTTFDYLDEILFIEIRDFYASVNQLENKSLNNNINLKDMKKYSLPNLIQPIHNIEVINKIINEPKKVIDYISEKSNLKYKDYPSYAQDYQSSNTDFKKEKIIDTKLSSNTDFKKEKIIDTKLSSNTDLKKEKIIDTKFSPKTDFKKEKIIDTKFSPKINVKEINTIKITNNIMIENKIDYIQPNNTLQKKVLYSDTRSDESDNIEIPYNTVVLPTKYLKEIHTTKITNNKEIENKIDYINSDNTPLESIPSIALQTPIKYGIPYSPYNPTVYGIPSSMRLPPIELPAKAPIEIGPIEYDIPNVIIALQSSILSDKDKNSYLDCLKNIDDILESENLCNFLKKPSFFINGDVGDDKFYNLTNNDLDGVILDEINKSTNNESLEIFNQKKIFYNFMTDLISNEFIYNDNKKEIIFLFQYLVNNIFNKLIKKYIEEKKLKEDQISFLYKGGTVIQILYKKYSELLNNCSDYPNDSFICNYSDIFKRSDSDYTIIIKKDNVNLSTWNKIYKDMNILTYNILEYLKNYFANTDCGNVILPLDNINQDVLKKKLEQINTYFNNNKDKLKIFEKIEKFIGLTINNITYMEESITGDLQIFEVINDEDTITDNRINNKEKLFVNRNGFYISAYYDSKTQKYFSKKIIIDKKNNIANKKGIYNYFNQTNNFKSNHFTLHRIKINCILYYKTKKYNCIHNYGYMLCPAELIDVPISKYDDHKLSDESTKKYYLYKKYKNYNDILQKEIIFNSYNLSGFLLDLFITFEEVDFPWNINKYEKKLKRTIILFLLYLYNAFYKHNKNELIKFCEYFIKILELENNTLTFNNILEIIEYTCDDLVKYTINKWISYMKKIILTISCLKNQKEIMDKYIIFQKHIIEISDNFIKFIQLSNSSINTNYDNLPEEIPYLKKYIKYKEKYLKLSKK